MSLDKVKAPAYDLLSTILYDPSLAAGVGPFFLLGHHLDRLERDINQSLRIRLLLSRTNGVTAETFPFKPLSDPTSPYDNATPPTWDVYLDTAPTTPSAFTSHKTTYRPHYSASRTRCLPPNSTTSEVLLYNPNGEVMEGSITNVAFWRDGKWITPKLRCGGLGGVMRGELIEKGVLEERVVKLNSVSVGEVVMLMNGVRGSWGGVVRG
ncbi:D-aminoacid aminotransferase-like PLP-dependent enzyme [Saitoella complicata NRRL Y-17804]|uniref:D-aminoacid aminotransferase-like PLP-dependent enzyme n=1 Tax=Saitoella complicata (strain BCRC 22490 / CBS 7301 / JCM 7358 / NBRC 10748 / NRRL Y-17804) TaxID=698492 RepID=UPI0008671411|nr:D-aminoacid aminotransferase-like PLP-dependent enzyme [Saitoella complicata NRRL Y-17804]ODQ55325.1 D-aminoacid aminotransferase-like PLP-dependent enzyme [Saitoella complicata NRRL Y-17804]